MMIVEDNDGIVVVLNCRKVTIHSLVGYICYLDLLILDFFNKCKVLFIGILYEKLNIIA
ncbi:MAG: hypothetical protein K1W37_14080 [Lachnospiraceae bacterium]